MLWVPTAMSVLLLVGGPLDAVPLWAVAHGQGESGTFTATSTTACRHTTQGNRPPSDPDFGCSFYGTFVPDSGADPVTGVREDNLPVFHVGDQTPAVRWHGKAYPPSTDWWQVPTVMTALGAVGTTVCTVLLLRRRRRRKAAPTT
ncbi:hypothetical protein [Kitasatospora cineracea]|uniref:hypothetical protein n=1 Tax=Kitasatospora cineracea TaxID=88074 RepID=UPI003805C3E7